MWTLSEFYRSKEWEAFRKVIIDERTDADGFVRDEVTGKPIVKQYDIILHHCKTFLTEENVNDRNISLNPDNIQIVSHKTHNMLHDKLGYRRKEIFLVYGPPLSGKTSYVQDILIPCDLVIDMDNIWQCISGLHRYQKPGKLNAVAFMVRDCLMDAAKVRNGKWQNCYIIGGFPLISDRERILKTYNAREVFLNVSREECLTRLASDPERDKTEWSGYIDEWFRRYAPQIG
jgi:hypothetical protein